MENSVQRHANGNIELTLTIPWAEIQTAYTKAVDEAVEQAEIKGFRKGKAPRNMVESRLDRNHTLSHALQHLLPHKYQAAVDKAGLKPVVYPRIRITKGQEGEDWVIVATLCEAPLVKLGKITKGEKLEETLEKLVQDSQVQVADILIETEADNRLSQLADNLTKLGISVDKYLATKKMSAEELRSKLALEARRDLNTEFILQQVQVDHKLENRQKTLDFLTAKV